MEFQKKGVNMLEVMVRGKQKATVNETEDGCFILDVNQRVKVSEHRQTFKDWETLEKYLSWLFDGKHEITPSV